MPPFKDSILIMFHKVVILGKVYRDHQIQYVQICDLQSQKFSWRLDICPIPFQLAQPHLISPPPQPKSSIIYYLKSKIMAKLEFANYWLRPM